MSNFDDLCSVLENLDPRTYRGLMMKKTQDILVAFGAMSEDTEDNIALYCDFLLCAVAADGVLTEEEFLLAKPVLDRMLDADISFQDRMLDADISFQDALEYFGDYGLDQPEGYKDTMDGIVDMLGTVSPTLKDDIILVCMLVCAVDGVISEDEKSWIRQLIE